MWRRENRVLALCQNRRSAAQLENDMAGLAALGRTVRAALVAGLAAASAWAAPALAQPALWAVKDADSTIYFLGTVHLLRPDTQWHSEKLDAAIAQASELWLELPTTNLQKMQGEMLALVGRYGISPRRLSADLTPDELKTLDEAAKVSGMRAAQLDNFRPWFAALTISTSAIQAAGYDPTSGVDSKIEAAFGERGIAPRGLETAEQQIKVFAGMSREEELEYLRQAIADYREASSELDRMVANWASGDIAAMEEMFVEEMKADDQALYDALLTNRNANWVMQVEKMLEGKGVIFIAVGAGHLVGPDSVIAMLEAKGIKAERVQ
jgi:uncharacterized protein YbaP (TraB family)